MPWMERNTTVYKLSDLPFDMQGKLTLIAPHLVRVYIPGYKFPMDVGSWCYSVRRRKSGDNTREESVINLVDTDSYRTGRRTFITNYLDYLSQHIRLGKSPASLKTSVGQFQRFVNWCDDSYVQGLDSQQHYIDAVGAFTDYLIDLVRKSQMNINTAATLQLVLFTAGRNIYSDRYGDLFRGVRKISRSFRAVNITETPEQKQARSALKFYTSLFHQLSDFVIDFERFPKRLDFEHGYYWFFPTQMPFAGPSNIEKKTQNGKNYKAYDYINGTIFSVEEIARKIPQHRSQGQNAKIARNRALTRIDQANNDKYSIHRMRAASMAFQAFMMLFSSSTGMSLGQFASLEWSGDYQVGIDRQGFRSIKYRAGGRPVEFYIEARFLNLFRKALRLRDHLIKGTGRESFNYLFFSFNGKDIYPLSMNLSTDFHRRLEICFDFKTKITTRMWRAHKSNWLLEKADLSTTATLLQNTPETVIKHYSEGSDQQASKELTDFFTKFKNDIIISNEKPTNSIATGQCVELHSPTPSSHSHIQPDCKTPEGCLFCENFRIHADTMDYRKILSLKYILEHSKHLAFNDHHFEEVLQPVIEAINSIASQIEASGKLSKVDAQKIQSSIQDEELLSKYWAKKLQLMDDLELI